MRIARHVCSFMPLVVLFGALAHGQAVVTASGAVPNLIKYNGVLTDLNGKPLSGFQGVTFLLYSGQQGSPPLWMETQNVQPDKNGRYTVMLGSTSSQGLPTDVFASGEARWLGVQVVGQAEQPRVLLVAVPYALEAADAETLGGLPASAFVRAGAPIIAAASNHTQSTSVQPLASGTTPVTTAGGTRNQLAKFDSAADITSSQITDNGTNVGIGTGSPASTLDVNGSTTVRGTLDLPAQGTASSTNPAGFPSQPIDLFASAWNTSGTPAATTEHFRWQAEAAASNTSSPSGTMNLLFASGTNRPAETGFSISSKGIITFAAGQTLPAVTVTGSETVNGNVTARGQLISNVATGTAPLAVASTTQVKNLNSSLLGGLSSSAFAQLTAANTFTKTQTINGNLALPQTTGAATGVITIAGQSFLHGVGDNTNAFVGPLAGAGFKTTGFSDTGVGNNALFSNTSGTNNTAVGGSALVSNTTGVQNTALGGIAGFNVTSGSNNTFIGYGSGVGIAAQLNNATAIGANAVVNQSSALVLGGTGSNAVNVGIGTPTPLSLLDLAGLQHTLIGNTGCGGAFGGIGFGASALADCTHYSLLGEGFHTYLNRPAGGWIFFNQGNNPEMVLSSAGRLGIGTTAPSYLLHVNGTMRAETGLSMGGNAVLSVDAPGVAGGQFLVQNGTVSIGGDTPMSSNPRMTFSGFLNGGFCDAPECGNQTGSYSTPGPNGFLVPDKDIQITRMTVALQNAVAPTCIGVRSGNPYPGPYPAVQILANGSEVYRLQMQGNAFFIDSGSIAVNASAGQQLIFGTVPVYVGCNLGDSAGGIAFVTVQYVMR